MFDSTRLYLEDSLLPLLMSLQTHTILEYHQVFLDPMNFPHSAWKFHCLMSFLSPNGVVKWNTKRRNSKSWWGMVFLWFGDKELTNASGSRCTGTRQMQTFWACVVSCCKKTTCKPQIRSPSTSNLLRSVKYVSKFKT